MKQKGTLSRVIRVLLKHRLALLIAIFASIIQVLATLLIPIVVADGIDYLVGPNDVNFNKLNQVIIYVAILGGLEALFGYLMQYLMAYVTNCTVKDLRDSLFNKLDRLPISYIDTHQEGDLLMRLIGDADQLGDGLLQALTNLISGIITIVLTLTFMLIVSYQVGLIVICLTPLSLLSAYFIAKFSFKTFKAQAQIKGKLSAHYNEMFNMLKIVKTYNYEDESYKTANEINAELYKVGVKAQFLSALVNPTTRFINSLVYASVGIYGALRAVAGLITAGDLTVFLNYAQSYTKPFNDISQVMTELQNSLASARRIFEVIDEKEFSYTVSQELTTVKGKVEFRNVSFSYVPTKPLITNFNLVVKPNSKIAIVGPTGAGKTTLINLLMRFYDVNQGKIFLDDKDIYTLDPAQLRANIGMVLQDTWTFKASILANIAYGKSDCSKADVIKAAKEAYADSFITRLPQGYNTIINSSTSLSEGQRQLLCIARVMLRRPPVLILDEATSNIDTRTEVLVQQAFNKLMEGRTSFVIAHRLKTIIDADLIIVLNKGQIVELGKHDELLAKGGFYKEIYEAQFAKIE